MKLTGLTVKAATLDVKYADEGHFIRASGLCELMLTGQNGKIICCMILIVFSNTIGLWESFLFGYYLFI